MIDQERAIKMILERVNDISRGLKRLEAKVSLNEALHKLPDDMEPSIEQVIFAQLDKHLAVLPESNKTHAGRLESIAKLLMEISEYLSSSNDRFDELLMDFEDRMESFDFLESLLEVVDQRFDSVIKRVDNITKHLCEIEQLVRKTQQQQQ
jgi:chromosome segregation ATPase